MKIKYISDDGIASEIVKLIGNNSMEISVTDRFDNSYPLKYDIKIKDTKLCIITIFIKYPYPANISQSQVPDILRIKVVRRI